MPLMRPLKGVFDLAAERTTFMHTDKTIEAAFF